MERVEADARLVTGERVNADPAEAQDGGEDQDGGQGDKFEAVDRFQTVRSCVYRREL